ncbi:sugar-transfer associated ATP-grasp domain-containing protein [Winogradskyella ursingii]|uniref:sugar-transfer associated ATP-grasp domain-containing protein n=1 Tax=Winogradskyella ursingii TaxID=2686079 RepID=UPI0015CE4194|nr:sugar-transfer associated ATP-grasp domain-containing protein [Winogradskyella ursingii]
MPYYQNNDRIKVFLKDKHKKPLFKMIKEFRELKKVKGETPYYYFKYLYRKDITNHLDYLSAAEMNLIRQSKRLHNPELTPIFKNKLLFSQLFEKSDISTPKLISYNINNEFYIGTEKTIVTNEDELFKFFENRFADTNVESIFFRPHSDYGGHGCFKLTKKDLKTQISNALEMLLKNNYVHTEIIEQHPEINKIHASSVNTMRILTLVTSSNDVKVVYAGFRLGVGDSVVDNSSSGGFFIGTNMDKGTLDEHGFYLIEYGGGKVYEHPDNGFKLEGFKIPFFKEACELAKKGVELLPDGFIGWDVAITPNGPTIVEANDMPHLQSSDRASRGFLKNPYMKELISELKEEKRKQAK